MKKLAYGGSEVYVSLTPMEFSGLAGQAHSNVPDGTNVSLNPVKVKIDLVDSKTAELAELKSAAQTMITKLTIIGI